MNLLRFRLIVDPLPSESEATWNPRITHENEDLFVVIASLKHSPSQRSVEKKHALNDDLKVSN